MSVKLLTEHLEFLSLKGDCTGLYESTLVKLPHYWKSRVEAQICLEHWHMLSGFFSFHGHTGCAIIENAINNRRTRIKNR